MRKTAVVVLNKWGRPGSIVEFNPYSELIPPGRVAIRLLLVSWNLEAAAVEVQQAESGGIMHLILFAMRDRAISFGDFLRPADQARMVAPEGTYPAKGWPSSGPGEVWTC